MLENLFGGLAPTDKTKLTGVGADPRQVGLMGNAKARIQSKMVLPTEISANQVLKQAEELGQAEAELELAKTIADYQGKQVEQLVNLHQINSSYSEKMMQVDQRVRSIDAGHARKVSQYQLGAGETQAHLDGYRQIHDVQATEIFG